MSQWELTCSLCKSGLEDAEHLFISCIFSSSLWAKVYGWLGLNVVKASKLDEHFLQHGDLFVGVKGKKMRLVIWHVVMWSIWLQRNEVIFKDCKVDSTRLMDVIKCRSWNWFNASVDRPASFSKWCINPFE